MVARPLAVRAAPATACSGPDRSGLGVSGSSGAKAAAAKVSVPETAAASAVPASAGDVCGPWELASAGNSLPASGKDLPPGAASRPGEVGLLLAAPGLLAGLLWAAARAASSKAAVNAGLAPGSTLSAPVSPESPRKALKTASSPVVFIAFRLQSGGIPASVIRAKRSPGCIWIGKLPSHYAIGGMPALPHGVASHVPTLSGSGLAQGLLH